MTGRPDPRSAWTVVFLVNLGVLMLLVLAVLVYTNPAFRVEAEVLFYPVCVALAAVSVWSLWSWRALTGSLFNPYALFLLAAILFNAGLAFLEVFGLNREGFLEGQFSPETNLSALFLVALGLAAFHTGGLLSLLFGDVDRGGSGGGGPAAAQDPEREALHIQAVRLVGWGLLAVSLVPVFVVTRETLSIVLSSGYAGIFQREASTGFEAGFSVLAGFLIPGSLFLLAGSKGYTFNIAVSTATVLLYTSVLFFQGSRAWPVMMLLAFAWVWHRCINPLPKTLLLGTGGFLLVVLFPLIRATRTMAGEGRLSLGVLWESYFSIENPVVDVFSEMGGTIVTVAYTIDLVPGFRDFDLGAGYLYAFSAVFPNLFWDLHPAIAYGTPDAWLIRTVDPFAASEGAGLGYSFIAEAYLNFGWLGAPVALALIGFFFGAFFVWGDRATDPMKVAAVATFMGFVLMYVRQDASFIFRSFFWYAIIPYLGVCFLRSCIKPNSLSASNRRAAGRVSDEPARDGGPLVYGGKSGE